VRNGFANTCSHGDWTTTMKSVFFVVSAISYLSTTGKQFEKVILKIVHKHTEEGGSFLSHAYSVFRWKAKCLRQEKCEQGLLKVLSCPLLCTTCNKWTPQNTWCLPSPLCQRHLSVCDRSQGGVCCQKTPVWSQLNGDLLWALEY
jgi:hypothetical protein